MDPGGHSNIQLFHNIKIGNFFMFTFAEKLLKIAKNRENYPLGLLKKVFFYRQCSNQEAAAWMSLTWIYENDNIY